MVDQRRLHPQLTVTDLESTPFVPELSPVVDRQMGGELMTRPWLDWARRLTLLVGVKTGGGSGGTGDVVGPAGATPDDIAIYSGNTGKVIKDSLKSIGSVINDAVTQAIAAILPGGKLPLTNLPLHRTTHEPGGADAMTVDAVPTTGSLRTLGTGPNQAAPGNDVRFATPANHAPRHSAGGADPVTVTNLAGYPGGTSNFLRADGTFATPAAGVPGPHHATHEIGGGDTLVNAAWTNQPNVFTQDQTLSKSPGPRLLLTDVSVPVDTRTFRISNEGQGLRFIPQTDVGVPQNNGVVIGRQGNIDVAGDAYVTGSVGNVACKDQANTFIQAQILSAAVPILRFIETGAPANQRAYDVIGNAQQLKFRTLTDDFSSAPTVPLALARSGNALVWADIYEKQRAVALGHWQDVAFDAARFFGAAGATWTVTAGSVSVNRFTLVGKTFIWQVRLVNTTVGGSGTNLQMYLPPGFVANSVGVGIASIFGGGVPYANMLITAGGFTLDIARSDGAVYPATAAFSIQFCFTIEVQ